MIQYYLLKVVYHIHAFPSAAKAVGGIFILKVLFTNS